MRAAGRCAASTASIIADSGIKLCITGMQGEYVTPTGAAIAAAVRTDDVLPETFVIKKIGLGAGKRAGQGSGILRAMIIEPE